jgi:hypothetical protein
VSSWELKQRFTEFTTQMLWPFLISTRNFSLRDIGRPKKQWHNSQRIVLPNIGSSGSPRIGFGVSNVNPDSITLDTVF